MSKEKYKPLSFSTTMRNPQRIASFLNCLLPYENKILTNEIINTIISDIIRKKLYKPTYISRVKEYNNVYLDEDKSFSNTELEDIIENAPQNHKEAGFEKGWPSRFDTWYKLPKEFGFIYYEMNEPILISHTGHMLIDAHNELPINEEKIENVFCNSLAKYPLNNPFRKILNSNVPLVLLLKVLSRLDNNTEYQNKGIFKKEIPLFLCWPNSDDEELYKYIINIRKHHKFSYSDEFIYDNCLQLLNATEKDKLYFKMNKICKESVDEYIRKMRMTGLLSLRGNGRFLDINRFKLDKINYILANYKSENLFDNKIQYYRYMGEIDSNIINIKTIIPENSSELKINAINKFANDYSKEAIMEELKILCYKNTESKDPVLRFINGPARLEFLTSIAIKQNFPQLKIFPQYPYDDEGLPTSTAGGGIADIICSENIFDDLIEVTLMCGRSDQVNNEIIPIARHLKTAKDENPNTISLLIAPYIHQDTYEAAEWQNHKYNLQIYPYDMISFINLIKDTKCLNLSEMIVQ